jgi:3-hydroxyisobutyrate dehydrogenase
MNDRPRVGFAGLGLMGMPMVQRLCAAGHAVSVWNRSSGKLGPACAAGAMPLPSPAALAAECDLVCLCLTDTQAVAEVVFDTDGIASTRARARFLVDHSSIRPDATRDFAARLEHANGMRWIDAPVSGGTGGAAAGTLAIMCGGAAADVGAVEPILRAYAAHVTVMGPTGAGQTTKLCNQVIVGVTVGVIAEAVRLAQAAGIDAGALPAALAGGWADSKPLQIFAPRMVHGYAQSIGSPRLLMKDLETAIDLARALNTPVPLAGLAAQLFRALASRGYGDADMAEFTRLFAPDRAPDP